MASPGSQGRMARMENLGPWGSRGCPASRELRATQDPWASRGVKGLQVTRGPWDQGEMLVKREDRGLLGGRDLQDLQEIEVLLVVRVPEGSKGYQGVLGRMG